MRTNTHVGATVRALLDSLTVEEACAHSFSDFHVPGLDYLCLFRSERYTAKVYFIPSDAPHNEQGFLVNPHSHSYAFRQTVLSGLLFHTRFEITDAWDESDPKGILATPHDWNIGRYFSPLATGEPGRIEWNGFANTHDRQERYEREQGYFLHPHEIHTIRVPFGAVLFTEQYADARLDSTTFLSVEREAPDLEGLYTPMTEERARYLMDDLQHAAPCFPLHSQPDVAADNR